MDARSMVLASYPHATVVPIYNHTGAFIESRAIALVRDHSRAAGHQHYMEWSPRRDTAEEAWIAMVEVLASTALAESVQQGVERFLA